MKEIDPVQQVVDLVKAHFSEVLTKQETNVANYMNNYMTQEERNQHGDNIMYMLEKANSSLAFFELKLMANQINYK